MRNRKYNKENAQAEGKAAKISGSIQVLSPRGDYQEMPGYENNLAGKVELAQNTPASAEEIRERQSQDHLNAVLEVHGFKDRIDIKSGVTATIAIFSYIGSDPDILALSRNGYVMVKLPPLLAAADSHAQLTYRNECDIISHLSHLLRTSRPMFLTKKIMGIEFILNSPVFFDEDSFKERQEEILSEDASESHSEIDIDTKQALAELIRESFHNLSTYMTELSTRDGSPLYKIDCLFHSMLNAVNELHRDGVLHLDLADRNFVVRRDGTVALVDFGVSDILFKVNNRSRSNKKYPQVSLLFNQAALIPKDYSIDLITDYVCLQKTMMQAIADYCGANFYALCTQGLGDAAALGISYTELLAQFKDEIVIENAIKNLREKALDMIRYGDIRGKYALAILEKYTPYFRHVHKRGQNYIELCDENNRQFYACSPGVRIEQSGDNVAQSVRNYTRALESAANAKSPVLIVSKSAVANAVQRYGLLANGHHADMDKKLFRLG